MAEAAAVCRLLVDPPAEGAWNMAVDEALLHSAAETNLAVLRLYQWSAPTLSLGYFQDLADRQLHPASAECAVVRRASGGGAILHDRELTYSLTLPAGHWRAADPAALYRAVHLALIAALREVGGAEPNLCESVNDSRPQPFLCFQRRAVGDVQLEGPAEGSPGPCGPSVADQRTMKPGRQKAGGYPYKIAGSAQRRGRGAILQHGSVLLGRSVAAPELPGWRELSGEPLAAEALAERFAARLAADLPLELRPSGLTPAERLSAERFVGEKYGHPGWTARR